jgi:Xaa-Pro aminopeptidase
MSEAVVKLIKKLKSAETIAVEKSTSLADFGQLRKGIKGRLKSVANVVETVRRVKDSSEVSAIKAAARVASEALKKTRRYIKAGTTESELAGMLDFQIRRLGAQNSFETIVAFGPNASRPHHQPGRRKLKNRDTVLIDFGAKYKGYCSDITRCFVLGRPSAFYSKVYENVEKAQAAAIKTVRAGVDMVQVDSAARETIRRSRLPVYGHGTGHGLGLEIHEQPFLARESKGKLHTGMVLTIEPGIYIPGKVGVRIEDDVLVTQNGYKILTRNCPNRPRLSN